MNDMPFSCGMMMGGKVSLCPALNQLRQEHIPLREQMEELFQSAQKIGENPAVEDWRNDLSDLKEKAVLFEENLDPHSKREEGYLFPMMAKYIGSDTGPIAVMEYEHQQGKENLQAFISKAEQVTEPLDAKRAKEISSYLIEAYYILSQHFMKEENVLFPMAERMLSAEEKSLLKENIQK